MCEGCGGADFDYVVVPVVDAVVLFGSWSCGATGAVLSGGDVSGVPEWSVMASDWSCEEYLGSDTTLVGTSGDSE